MLACTRKNLGVTGVVVSPTLFKGTLVILSHWVNIHWTLQIHCATELTLLVEGGDCKHGTIARARSAGGKFWELLPVLTNHYIQIKNHGKIFDVCLRSVVLYGWEYWALRKKEMIENDRVILRWIFLLKPSDIKYRFSLEEFGNRATYNITMIQTFDLFRSCEP